MTSADTDRHIRHALALLEADLRELALLALADWERLEIAAPAALFRAVAGLQRPSWGHWNGLLAALRDARKAVLRTGSPAQRDRVRQAATLEAVLEFLDREAGPDLAEQLRPLADLVRGPLSRRPRMAALLSLPITLRNLVAHFAPADPAWWERAAEALRPLADAQAAGELRPNLPGLPRYSAPWFWSPAGSQDVGAFNGLRDNAVLYTSRQGSAWDVPEMLRPALLAFNRLLGRTGLQEENFRRLLQDLAPAELKSVLLGDYLVGQPIGCGGYAAVHTGTQLSTGRKVAVKILHDGMTRDARERFRHEAVYLSRLNHPHIIRVLGAGEDTWMPPREPAVVRGLAQEAWYQELAQSAPLKCYTAMEWIDGGTLEDVYQGRRQPEPDTRQLAEWFLQAAEALGAVHAAGLLHRDVKPGNLMVTKDGNLVLMDFGIARTLDEGRTVVTTPGHALGTPAYMAPEQISSKDADAEIGPASDLYSLCATFYELFTRSRLFAHDRETEQAVQTRKLTGARPERPRRLARQLPWELDAIVMGGLEPGVPERYRSMADLERDLRHYLHDEPIAYRRPSLPRRLRLWYRRNTWVANLGALAATFLIVAAVVGSVAAVVTAAARDAESLAKDNALNALKEKNVAYTDKTAALGREKTARTAEEKQRKLADAARDDAKQKARDKAAQLHVSQIGRSYLYWQANDVRRAQEVLDACDPEYRGWEWNYLQHLYHSEVASLHGDFGLTCLARSRDGKTLAAGRSDGSLSVWITFNGRLLRLPRNPSFLPLDDIGLPRRDATQDDVEVASIALSPDGRWLAAASRVRPRAGLGAERGEVKVWESVGPKVLWSLPLRVNALAASPDGKLLALGADERVTVWDMDTQRAAFTLATPKDYVRSLAFSADGRQLATGGMSGWARVWDVKARKAAAAFDTGDMVWSLAFAPDGKQLATGGTRGRIDLWDLKAKRDKGEAARPWLTLRGHIGVVKALAFYPNQPALVSGGNDRTVRLWDLRSGDDFRIFRGHEDAVTGVLFSPDRKQIWSSSLDTHVKFWDPFEDQEALARGGIQAAVSPDGRYVATTGAASRPFAGPGAKVVAVWDAPTGKLLRTFQGHRHEVNCVAFSPDSRRAASGGDGPYPGGEIKLWDPATGNVLQTLEDRGSVYRVAFRPDGRVLASACRPSSFRRVPGLITFWDLEAGRKILTLAGPSQDLESLTYSPDGKLLALAGDGLGVQLVDARTGQDVLRLAGAGRSAAFSKDGKQLATTGGNRYEGGWVKVWDVATGTLSYELKGHSGACNGAAFSPDGKRIASAGEEGLVRLWDTATRQEILTLKHPGNVNGVLFDPHGRFLVSSSGNFLTPGDTRLWLATPVGKR